MDTFNLVSDPNNQYIEPQVTTINTVDVKDADLRGFFLLCHVP